MRARSEKYAYLFLFSLIVSPPSSSLFSTLRQAWPDTCDDIFRVALTFFSLRLLAVVVVIPFSVSLGVLFCCRMKSFRSKLSFKPFGSLLRLSLSFYELAFLVAPCSSCRLQAVRPLRAQVLCTYVVNACIFLANKVAYYRPSGARRLAVLFSTPWISIPTFRRARISGSILLRKTASSIYPRAYPSCHAPRNSPRG